MESQLRIMAMVHLGGVFLLSFIPALIVDYHK